MERHTLQDFATHAVSHDPHSLQSTMSNLHHLAKGLGMRTGPHERRTRYAFKQGLFRQLQTVLTVSGRTNQRAALARSRCLRCSKTGRPKCACVS